MKLPILGHLDTIGEVKNPGLPGKQFENLNIKVTISEFLTPLSKSFYMACLSCSKAIPEEFRS